MRKPVRDLFPLVLLPFALAQPATSITPNLKTPSNNPFVDYCGARDLSPSVCGNKFFSGDAGPSTWAGQQAAATCASKADQRSAEVAALYRWLGTDPGDMMWYASGGKDGFSPENKRKGEQWWWDPQVQKYYTSVPTPQDRSEAKEMATGMATAVADGVKEAIKLSNVFLAGVGAKAGGNFAVGAAIAGGLLGSYGPDITAFFDSAVTIRGDLAYSSPWTIGKESTGLYYAGDSFATAPDGTTFSVKPTYPPPGTPGIPADGPSAGSSIGVSGGSGSGSGSGSTGSGSGGGPANPPGSHSSSPTHDPDEIVITNPWITDESGIMPGEAIARPVLDDFEKDDLKKCIEDEERKLIDKIGTMDIAAWYDVPKSDAEIKAEKDKQLKNGLCDKVYYGEDFCRKWKIERDSEEIPPDMQMDLDLFKQLRALSCPPNSHPERETFCHHVQQEVLKRYFVDDLGEKMVDRAFQPIKPEERLPPTTVFPPLPGDDLSGIIAKLTAEKGKPPKRPSMSPSTPFRPPKVPSSDPPRLPHGGIGLPSRPTDKADLVLSDIIAKLGKGGFGKLPKPSNWDDSGIVWGGAGAPSSDSASARLKRIEAAKIGMGGKPAGWTTKQWRDFQALLEKAGAKPDESSGHDEL